MIKLVSTNKDKQIEQERARQDLDYATRQCVANILRVMAGTGDEHILFQQINGLMEKYARFINLEPDVSPSFTFAEILRSYEPLNNINSKHSAEDIARWRSDPHEHAQEEIVRYSLRLAAANLLGQLAQARRSESGIWGAIWDRVRK